MRDGVNEEVVVKGVVVDERKMVEGIRAGLRVGMRGRVVEIVVNAGMTCVRAQICGGVGVVEWLEERKRRQAGDIVTNALLRHLMRRKASWSCAKEETERKRRSTNNMITFEENGRENEMYV